MTDRPQKIISLIGTLLMLVSFVFIVIRITQYDIDFSALTSPLIVSALLILSCIAGLGYFFAGIVYKSLLEALSGNSLDRGLVVKVYCICNMYKYIPGGVMYAVGRNRLAFETNRLNHSTVAVATVTEVIVYAAAGFVTAIFFSFEHFMSYIRQISVPTLFWGGLACLTICTTLIVAAVFRQRDKGLFKNNLIGGLSPALMAKVLGAHILILLLQTVTYPITLIVMGQPIDFATIINIIGLYALAWLIGFLTPGAPSGFGVREVVMLMFLGGVINEEVLLSSIVIHRAMGVIGDVFVCFVAIVYSKKY